MRKGHLIIDADRHVTEPIEMWREYLEPEFREHAPYYAAAGPEDAPAARVARWGAKGLAPPLPVIMLDGQPIWQKLSESARIELGWSAQRRIAQILAGSDARAQLRSMDRTGIDAAVLYPTFAMYLMGIDELEPALAAAFARAYNNWLHDLCRAAPDRLLGAGVISPHDPAQMVAELRRVAGFGWRVVVLRPNPIQGRLLGDPAYEPFWSACEQLSMAVAVHEGAHARSPSAGADRFESRFALHACSHPMEQMMAFLALLEGGVLERHPGLRVAFFEAGCGWLPYWLWRLDEVEYKHLAGEVEQTVRMKPSAYFRRQCFVAFEPDEPYLTRLLPDIGEDQLLFGTDFPHLDHEESIVDVARVLLEKMPEETVRKLLHENASRFLGL